MNTLEKERLTTQDRLLREISEAPNDETRRAKKEALEKLILAQRKLHDDIKAVDELKTSLAIDSNM